MASEDHSYTADSSTEGTGTGTEEEESSCSESYTSMSSSTVCDPPSSVHMDVPKHSMSAISDPSAASSTSSSTHNHPYHSTRCPPVQEDGEEEVAAAEVGVETGSKDLPLSAAVSIGTSIVTASTGSVPRTTSETADEAGSRLLSALEIDTSLKSDGTNMANSNNASAASSPAAPLLPLECDYDVNPTELYQAIESKQWDHVMTLFTKNEVAAQRAAATWVTRKEMNGKLRWRLLPIHAAIIFQSPAPVVERLLQECPEAAQAKDDQGMLPLHLAFRTKNTCWETVEELITHHPAAVFVKDRKGRTPLQCGLVAATAAAAAASSSAENNKQLGTSASGSMASSLSATVSKCAGNKVLDRTVQKAIFSTLEVYTQISVKDQLQTAMATSRTTFETRIGAVQDSHVATLTQLKADWERQRNELGKKIQGYKKEVQSLRSDFEIQQDLLEEKVKTEMELVDKLQQVTSALEAKTVIDEETVHGLEATQSKKIDTAHKTTEHLQKTNKDLLILLETLLDEQNSLKQSLDKLSWENKVVHQERKDLLEKFAMTNQESEANTTKYTDEWQQRLEITNRDISNKLTRILDETNHLPMPVDVYDGEEKKDSTPHPIDPSMNGHIHGRAQADP